MKKYPLLILLVFIGINAYTQSLSPVLVSSAGDSFDSAGNQLDFSLGEVAIDSYESNENRLTQGFHQPIILSVNVWEAPPSIQIELYPNPSPRHITLDITGAHGGFHWQLFGMDGKLLLLGNIPPNENRQSLDLAAYPSGCYLLRLLDEQGNKAGVFHLLKIQ